MVTGGDGNDVILGDGGADTLRGGPGNDILEVLKERLSEIYAVAKENFYQRPDGTRVPKFVNLDTILASTGKIIEVPERSVRACRTQIVTEVRDAATMAANWSSVLETEDAMTLLHRVVVYGDHMDSLRHLARLMKLNVVVEGRGAGPGGPRTLKKPRSGVLARRATEAICGADRRRSATQPERPSGARMPP